MLWKKNEPTLCGCGVPSVAPWNTSKQQKPEATDNPNPFESNMCINYMVKRTNGRVEHRSGALMAEVIMAAILGLPEADQFRSWWLLARLAGWLCLIVVCFRWTLPSSSTSWVTPSTSICVPSKPLNGLFTRPIIISSQLDDTQSIGEEKTLRISINPHSHAVSRSPCSQQESPWVSH